MLTDQSCRSAKARAQAEGQAVTIRDDGPHTGLELRCSPKGKATFSLVYRLKGDPVPKRFRLGHFPGTSLARVRDMIPDLRAQIVKGIDPAISARTTAATNKDEEVKRKATRRAAKIEEERKISASQLMDEFLAAKGGLRSVRQYRQMLDLNVRGAWGRLKAADITGRDIDAVLATVASRGNDTQPRRVFEVIRAMLAYAKKRSIIDGTPWQQVAFEFPERVEARDRVLSAADIRWLWALTERWTEDPNLQRTARLILLLGQRSNEVCGMRRAEISRDGKIWTLPPVRTKNKTTHVVPPASAGASDHYRGRGSVSIEDALVRRIAGQDLPV